MGRVEPSAPAGSEASAGTGPGRLWVGTSGFNYPHWRGCFYPERLPASRWLAFYARHFEAVELNVTFYRLPSAEAFGRWAESVPEGFRFVIKGSRFITHIRRLRGCEGPLEELLGRASALGERLAAILWQLPPGFPADPVRLEAFLGLLAGHRLGRRVRHAFEFREASWFAPPVTELLARYDAAAVLADSPFRGLRADPAARWVYVRRHGPGAPYQDSYPDATLAEDARAIRDWLRSGRDVLCFFNNDVAGHAVHDALRLRAMVEGAPPQDAG